LPSVAGPSVATIFVLLSMLTIIAHARGPRTSEALRCLPETSY